MGVFHPLLQPIYRLHVLPVSHWKLPAHPRKLRMFAILLTHLLHALDANKSMQLSKWPFVQLLLEPTQMLMIAQIVILVA